MTVRFVLAVILLICGVVALVVGNREIDDNGNVYHPPIRKIGFAVLVASALFFLLSTVRVVAPGEVGIPVAFGKAGAPLGAGVHLTNPFASVEKMSVRTENYTMSVAQNEGQHQGDDSVSVLGNDGGSGNVDTTTLFHLDQGSASRVFLDKGTGYVEKIIRPTVRTCIRDEFAKVAMVDAATSHRDAVQTGITTCIEKVLTPAGISVENLQVRDIHLSKELQDSINAKVAAQQSSQQQQFELSKAQQVADIARVNAQGQSDSQQIISCGGVTTVVEGVTKVEPRTGADCLNTLSPGYLQYLYIQALTKVAESPNNSTVIVPFDTALTPLLPVQGAH